MKKSICGMLTYGVILTVTVILALLYTEPLIAVLGVIIALTYSLVSLYQFIMDKSMEKSQRDEERDLLFYKKADKV